MPQPNDALHIVTDASVKEKGIAATLYILRDGKTSIAGFYSAKLKKHQQGWLPCEIEALSIGAAVKHFAPFIIQSKHPVQVLMDSKPCVQAHSKLLRCKFSASTRVTSFLSICSHYQVSVSHIAGPKNIPSDYGSRHPMSCPESSCQICKFASEMEESVVYSLSVQDVIDGSFGMPFANRIAWLATQREGPDLRRVYAHLSQGNRPSKRDLKIQDVKRYLQRVTIDSAGLLVVVSGAPFRTATQRIVVSRSVLHGLVTAVHLRFNHPTPYQMQQVMARYFYALDMEGAIKTTCSSWHHCNSLKYIPPPLVPQSSCNPPDIIGSSFALDVMHRAGQCILILRETVSSYAVTRLFDNEQHQTFRDAILSLVIEMRSCCRLLRFGLTMLLVWRPWSQTQSLSPMISSLCSARQRMSTKTLWQNMQWSNWGWNVCIFALKVVRLQWLHSPWQQPIWIAVFVIMVCQPRKCGLGVIRWLATNWPWTIAKLSSNSTVNALWTMVLVRYPNLKAKVSTLYPIYKSLIRCTLWVMVTNPRPVRSTWSLTCAQIICVWWGKSQFRSRSYKVKMCELYPVVPTTLLQHPEDTVRGLDNRQQAPLLSFCVPAPVLPFPSPRDNHAHTMPHGPPLPLSDLVIPPLPPSPCACDQPPPTCRPPDPPPPPVPLETELHHSGKEETLPTTRVQRNHHPPKW